MSDLIKRDDALLPCPFCGGKTTVYWGSNECTDADCYQAVCDSCGIKGKDYESSEEAIAAWNTRALPVIDPAAIREAALREAAWCFDDDVGHPSKARDAILALIGETK